MNGAPDRRKLVPPHLADSVLLAHLDGELSRMETEAARLHLEACWSCRRRLDALETSIGYYLDQRAPLQPQLRLDDDQRVRQFRERLARHSAASKPTIAETLHGYWNAMTAGVLAHRRAVIASIAAACLLVAMFTDVLGPRVSADTILNRAQTFEKTEHPSTGQIKRVAVKFERLEHKSGFVQPLATVTIIDDAEQSRAYLIAEAASGNQESVVLRNLRDGMASQPALLGQDWPTRLAGYLRSQHWLPAVTVEAFRQLTSGRGTTASSVQKDSDDFVVSYPFAEGHPSGISEARLRVDRHTFATMGLSIFLGSPTEGLEYRFSRVTTSIEPRTAEIAHLFSPHDADHVNYSLPAREPARVVPLSYASTRATDREVRLNSALHETDACLGDEIHVFPMSDGSLLVQGLVDKADRRDAVRRAVRSVDPATPAQIFLPQELRSNAQLFSLPYQTPALPGGQQRSDGGGHAVEESTTRIPLYEQLFQHFARPGVAPESTAEQVNAFSDEAVTLSRQTFLHAWALKKLDLEFSRERSAGLSPAAMQEVEHMRQDHRRRIAAISRRQSEMLARVGAGSDSPLTLTSPSSLDTDTLLHLAQEQNELVRSLFTVSNNVSETGPSISRLLDILRRIGA